MYKLIKSVFVVSFLFTILSLLIVNNVPAKGFEPSIYAATPLIVWISIGFSVVSSILMIFYVLFYGRRNNLIIFTGLFTVIFSNVLVISLGNLRDYYMWNGTGDTGAHAAIINWILSTGFINIDNFYPALHILSAELAQASNIDSIFFIRWLPILFSIICFVFIYAVAHQFLPIKNYAIVALLAGSTLLPGFSVSFTPFALSALFFPLAVFVTYKCFHTNKKSWIALYLMITFLYVIFHPLAVFVLLIFAIAMGIFCNYNKKVQNKSAILVNIFIYPVVLLVVFVQWIVLHQIFYGQMASIKNLLMQESSSSLNGMVSSMNYASDAGFNIIYYFLLSYSGLLIYLGLAFLSFIYIFFRKYDISRKIYPFAFSIFVVMIFIILFLNMNLYFSPTRFFGYLILLSIIPAGYFITECINITRSWLRKIVTICAIIILLILYTLGVLIAYTSPLTYSVNDQTIFSEIKGVSWLFNNKNLDIYYSAWRFSPEMYTFILNGFCDRARTDLTPYVNVPYPDHFGYDSMSNIGEYYSNDRYMIISEVLRKMYSDIYPTMAKYRLLPDDLEHLNRDSTVDKIYTNRGIDIWYINAL